MSATRKFTKSEAGAIGARRRWGEPPRVVRLDSLPPSVAAAIHALVQAERAALNQEVAAETAARDRTPSAA